MCKGGVGGNVSCPTRIVLEGSMDWEKIPGWYDWPQYNEKLVRELSGGVLIEVGTYLGRSLCHLGQLVKESGKPFTVIGVDTCRGSGIENGHDHHAESVREGGGTFAGQLHRNVVKCGLADIVTLIVAESERAASLFAEGTVASVFLDAGHDADSVSRDIRFWLPKVMYGGFIGGDDVGVPGEANPVWPGVREAVSRLLPGWRHYPHDAWYFEKR